MAEREPPQRGDSRAAGTLLGVPAPRVESGADSPLRSPVFVRSGTSIADVEEGPPPLPRMALPSRPLIVEPEVGAGREASFAEQGGFVAWLLAVGQAPARVLGAELALWMVAIPALLVWVMLMVVLLAGGKGTAPSSQPSAIATTAASTLATPNAAPLGATAPPALEKPSSPRVAELAGKAPDSLSSKELLQLADGRAEEQRDVAKALRAKIEGNPALAQDKAVQAQLLHLVSDAETARDALSAMASGAAPAGPDLLYEVWTGTTQRTNATDLARALVYSTDVRPKASAALSVALELRAADSCEQFETALPHALKDGDRRSLHLLLKLNAKRGCGPKKTEDCYACLRDQADELTATINAVKSRRPPAYLAP